jgi:hypothetical protein
LRRYLLNIKDLDQDTGPTISPAQGGCWWFHYNSIDKAQPGKERVDCLSGKEALERVEREGIITGWYSEIEDSATRTWIPPRKKEGGARGISTPLGGYNEDWVEAYEESAARRGRKRKAI